MAGFLSLSVSPASSVGPFTDVSHVSEFVTAPRGPGVTGSITRAESRGLGASVFNLAGFFPLRSSFFVQLETSFITVENKNGVVEGFGDVLFMSKAPVWRGRRKAVLFTSCIRLGTGGTAYFPYSTASTDAGIGLAFADSLGFADDASAPRPSRYLTYWITAGGTYVLRLNDRLEENELHGHHFSGGGGVVIGVSRRFDVAAGALGLVFDSGAVREVYFSGITAYLSPAAGFHVTVQGERGDWRERAVDASVQAGLTVRY